MNDRIPNQHHINIKGYKVVHYSTKQSSVATVFLVLNMYCFSYHKLPSTVVHKPAFQYCVLVTVHDGNPILCKLIGINIDTYSFLVYFRNHLQSAKHEKFFVLTDHNSRSNYLQMSQQFNSPKFEPRTLALLIPKLITFLIHLLLSLLPDHL